MHGVTLIGWKLMKPGYLVELRNWLWFYWVSVYGFFLRKARSSITLHDTTMHAVIVLCCLDPHSLPLKVLQYSLKRLLTGAFVRWLERLTCNPEAWGSTTSHSIRPRQTKPFIPRRIAEVGPALTMG
jgi:hypothetical protein